MCTLQNETKKRKGYKVLAYKANKYYSTFTGQEIKCGTVPKAPDYCRRLSYLWNADAEDTQLSKCCFYSKKFANKTSAFIKLVDAKDLAQSINLDLVDKSYSIVVTKILFTGTVFSGLYDSKLIIASDNIKSIKTIYQEDRIEDRIT